MRWLSFLKEISKQVASGNASRCGFEIDFKTVVTGLNRLCYQSGLLVEKPCHLLPRTIPHQMFVD